MDPSFSWDDEFLSDAGVRVEWHLLRQGLANFAVIPAKAGIHFDVPVVCPREIKMDPSLSWNDEFCGFAPV